MASLRSVTVEDYWREVGEPVDRTLQSIARGGVVIRRDASFDDFGALCRAPGVEALALVAHHVRRGDTDAAEFADGWRSFDDVARVAVSSRPLVLFLCDSAGWRDGLVRGAAQTDVAAGAAWKLPFRQSILFLSYWARACDGRRTFDESLTTGLQTFLARSDDEVPDE